MNKNNSLTKEITDRNRCSETINFRCSAILYYRLNDISKLLGKPKSQILRQLIEDFIFDFWTSERNLIQLGLTEKDEFFDSTGKIKSIPYNTQDHPVPDGWEKSYYSEKDFFGY